MGAKQIFLIIHLIMLLKNHQLRSLPSTMKVQTPDRRRRVKEGS
jgi:hypothetical protein